MFDELRGIALCSPAHNVTGHPVPRPILTAAPAPIQSLAARGLRKGLRSILAGKAWRGTQLCSCQREGERVHPRAKLE